METGQTALGRVCREEKTPKKKKKNPNFSAAPSSSSSIFFFFLPLDALSLLSARCRHRCQRRSVIVVVGRRRALETSGILGPLNQLLHFIFFITSSIIIITRGR
jgi:hypothetical protein